MTPIQDTQRRVVEHDVSCQSSCPRACCILALYQLQIAVAAYFSTNEIKCYKLTSDIEEVVNTFLANCAQLLLCKHLLVQ